jgi:DNA-binding transcriptional LysR family regulator
VAGAGFGQFFSYQVAPYVAQKQLRVVLESFEPPPRPISLVYPHARLLPMRTRVFIDWMRKELQGLNALKG